MPRHDLRIRRNLVIPEAELRESASRSSGPGGQHVNKSNTRVTLRWSIAESDALSAELRRRLLERLGSRLTVSGELVVHASQSRSRARNLEHARERLAELVRGALVVSRSRVPTRPTRSSKQRGAEAKQRRAKLKQSRAKPRRDAGD